MKFIHSAALSYLTFLSLSVTPTTGFVISSQTSAKFSAFGPSSSTSFSSSSSSSSNSSSCLFAKKASSKKNKKGITAGRSTGKGFGAPGTKEVVTTLASKTLDESSERLLGQTLLKATQQNPNEALDEFWEIIPALIHSKFPQATDHDLKRIAGVMSFILDPANTPIEASIIEDPYRPHEELHAYMPGLGATQPFYDPSQLQLCQLLSEHYDTIVEEYHALLEHDKQNNKDRFQSVTSMNYDSGWKTLVLFYNGHRIPDFPYHLCPITTKIMETVPLAGRIAGFNRQSPKSGIPLHSDGNNMWLTCQMGLKIPQNNQAWIRVGPETRHWEQGKCLLYDTTYEHETFNESEDEERVVLHIDFFNTLAMTKVEIDIMLYIYEMKEKFMKAEGVAKVGSQIL